MDDYRERVREEHAELTSKKNALADFLKRGKPDFITEQEWFRLSIQHSVMITYKAILEERIRNFK